MTEIEQKIIEKISKEGPITFEAFMETALYEPRLGYYTSPQTEIGRAGDYFTSPHLHSSFGAMLGRQIEEFWALMGKPGEFQAVEMGAGKGFLAKDILDYLSTKDIYECLRYFIVEISPFMEDAQRKLLRAHKARVCWVKGLEHINKIKGCLLSNELLDSFPVHLIEMDDSLKEIYVDFKGKFYEIKKAPTSLIEEYLKEFSIKLPKNYKTEVNLRIKDWLREIDRALSEGFILTIDYGYPAADYYSPERRSGTLLCYKGHQVDEDPYSDIGLKDITAHVNFSSLKKWGEELGFKTLGFCPQGTYLVALGIDEIISELYETSADYEFEIAKIKRLILPGTLGETHKVMIQWKGHGTPKLRGFSLRNQVRYL